MFGYQIYQKPTEILSVFEYENPRPPHVTWQKYNGYFRRYSTSVLSSDRLAALVQAESGGRPWASPNWKFSLSNLFAPSSSSVGLVQFTRETFDRAKGYCIEGHRVVKASQSYNPDCFLEGLRTRISPSDSIEVAAADLTRKSNQLAKGATDHDRYRLALVIHLCGFNRGRIFVKRGFDLNRMGYCGSHNVKNYVRRQEKLSRRFQSLAKN
jgi:hypothetical protein